MISTNTSKNNETETGYETLINCGKAIDQVLERDQVCPDLADLLQGSTSEKYVSPLLGSDEEFLKTHQVNLPASIRDQLEFLEIRCYMGLFPDINRAWMTIDTRLFLWNYKDGTDVYEYNSQDQIICTVGLIKPKTDIFGELVDYVLVVATPLQIIPLALSINENKPPYLSEGIALYATGLTIPADGIVMTYIHGTADGRIFMMGDNGHLYELEYSNPDLWFGRKCRLICRTENSVNRYIPTLLRTFTKSTLHSFVIDNERHVLYLLTDQSTIEVVYLGDPMNNYRHVVTYKNIVENALQMSRQQLRVFDKEDFHIESIHVISKAESKKLHLMAMTTAGFRLYFTHCKDALRLSSVPDTPNTLELGHVRLPASGNHSAVQYGYRLSYYDCGICVSVKALSEEEDSIIVTSPTVIHEKINMNTIQMNIHRTTLTETSATVDAHCRIWTIQEADKQSVGKHTLRDIAEHPCDPPRQFLALTGNSILVYTKQRPVDLLQRIIQSEQPTEKKQVEYKAFFDRYGQAEACAMCISIACSIDNKDVMNEATRLFFEYGGVPTEASATSTPNQGHLNHLGRLVGQAGVTYSGKHDGFLLYFSRLVSPIWKRKIFHSGTDIKKTNYLTELQAPLLKVRTKLSKLKSFMDANPSFHYTATISDPRFQTSDQSTLLIELAEQKSVHELYMLLVQCIEAISFIDFLTDTGVEEVISQLQDKNLEEVKQFDLNNMLITQKGREITKELVLSSIQKYGSIHMHADYYIVSELLKRRCSTFFDKHDFAFFKGAENIRRAYKSDSKYEKASALKDSLECFKEAIDYITDNKMAAICNDYIMCSFHVGIVELGLERAKKEDPQQFGLIAYESKAGRDNFNYIFYQKRLAAYEYIFTALKDARLMKTSPPSPDREPIEDKDVYINHVFSSALSSNDKLFHFQLYQWYINEHMTNELLSIDTVYLIPFFQNHVNDEQSSLDFLWQYYRRREQYYNAALLLKKLAFLPTHELSLGKRLEYLAYAHVNARCREPKNQHIQESTEFLQKIDEWINTARLQMRLQGILKSQGNPEALMAATQLDYELLSAQKLQELRDIYNV